jgi:competence ComEA-like helix-hairpin-helix protein
MHADETRAIKRAVLILLVVSAARWGWSRRPERSDATGPTVLPELIEGTREAAREGARRGEPLAEGEKVDPNRASDVELDRLPGVGPATALAIVAAREAGTVFRRPEDLLDVRGIGDATLERMRERLDLGDPPVGRASRLSPLVRPSSPSVPLDVNLATTDALEALPGIGPALAARIVATRQERMFTSVEDLERVPGVGPSTVERLRPHITVGRPR